MNEKLDPRLSQLVEEVAADRQAVAIDVLVAITGPMEADVRDELTGRGLTIRSEIGDVVTGTIMLDHLTRLAASPCVTKVEAGFSLSPEFGIAEDDRELPYD